MKDTEMLKAIYKATDNGMKIITEYFPEADECRRKGTLFKAYPKQRTPSCLIIDHNGVWYILGFSETRNPISPIGLFMFENNLPFRKALERLYTAVVDPQWTGTVEVVSDAEINEDHIPSRPEPDAQTLAFKNGYFRVTASSVERTQEPPDKTVGAFPCEFTRLPSLFTAQDMPRRFDPHGDCSHMFRIVACTSTARRDNPNAPVELTEEEARNLAAKLHAIGYMLHSYKDPAAKAGVWFHDTDPETGGCNGKTLTARWLSHFRKTVDINGRDRKITQRKFLFEKVKRETGIVLIDDLMPYSDTQKINEYVTEGITVERKMYPEMTLEYLDAPKIAVTAPHLPEEQHRGTWLTCGFGDFFNMKYRPFDHFGMSPYTQDYWNRDANFAVDCLQFYLQCRKDGMTVTEKGGEQ